MLQPLGKAKDVPQYLFVKGYRDDFGPNKDLGVITFWTPKHLEKTRTAVHQQVDADIKEQNYERWIPHITLGPAKNFNPLIISVIMQVLSLQMLYIEGLELAKDVIV